MSPRLQTEWEGDGPLAETAEPGATNPKKIYLVHFTSLHTSFQKVCQLCINI